MILTIASSKGGPGKTTLARLIVGTLVAEQTAVVAVDADPAGFLMRWSGAEHDPPRFRCHHEADVARLAHLLCRVAEEFDVVVVDTAGFGNRAATVAITAADAVLIPVLPGAGDILEAQRTLELVGAVAAASRRSIPARVVWNRMRPATKLSRHAAADLAMPRLSASLSDLVAFGEMSFSADLPIGRAAEETAAVIDELRSIGFLPPSKISSNKLASSKIACPA